MSIFEFISVLLSIVVGLALTRLLSGLGRALEIRHRLRFYWVQGVWVANMCLALVVFWWATLAAHLDNAVWSFSNFLVLLLYSVVLFLQATLIIPTDLEETSDLRSHFFSVHPWFFGLGALVALCEFSDTLLHGGRTRVLFLGPFYIFIIFSGLVMNLIAARTKNTFFHSLFAVSYFISMAGWMFARFGTIG